MRAAVMVLLLGGVAHADEPDEAEEIEIVDRAPAQTEPISYQLTADEARQIPGAGNDALRALQVLPGVARIPFSFGGLVLRGTSPNDTGIYLDGVEVPLAFHFGGFTSFYPSEMLSSLSIVPGNYDASYGRAEGGLVTLTTREPRGDRWRVSGSVGLLDSGASAEGPVGDGAIAIGVRGSYFAQVASPFVSADIPLPSYLDAQVRGSFGDATENGRWSPLVFTSIDRIANDPGANGGRGIAITQSFVRAAAPYLKTWGPLTLHVVPWLGVDRVAFTDNDNQSRTPETFSRPQVPGGVRADLTRDFSWGHVRGGVDTQGGYLSSSQAGFSGSGDGPAQQDGASSAAWIDVALWSEMRFRIDGDRLSIKPGVRAERFGLTDEIAVDPRIDLTERLTDDLTLRAAVGRYHQPPTPADVDPINGNPQLHASYFDQASLGIDATWSHLSASLTGFYGSGHDLGVRVPSGRMGDDYQPDFGGLGPTFDLLLERQMGFSFYRINVGRAQTYGAEAMIRYSSGRYSALASYTLARSQRTDDPAMTPYLWRPFELDQRHNLNVAGALALGDWRLGARVQLVSGNPYTPGPQDPWAGRLPAFFQLDLRADRVWKHAWGDLDLYVDIENATNRVNVEGRQLDPTTMTYADTPGLPIIPMIGLQLLTH